nr:hypothetical protein [Novosphingobium sp. Rr 2-17]
MATVIAGGVDYEIETPIAKRCPYSVRIVPIYRNLFVRTCRPSIAAIEDRDMIAQGRKMSNDGGADKQGAAGNEYIHR